MTADLILSNARMVLADEVVLGTVHVADGRIAAVDTGGTAVPSAQDFGGDYLMPGLVELHTDNLEKHIQPRPKVHWPTSSALLAHDTQVVAAGITTVLDAIAVGGTLNDDIRDHIVRESAEAIRSFRAAGLLRADHHLHMRCEVANKDVLRLFEPFKDDPLVRLVSLMDHTPGQRQFVDIDKLRIYYQGKHAMSEAAFQQLILDRKESQKLYSDRHRRILVELAREAGHVLASHDDATEEHVDEAAGLGLTISEFPTTMAAARAARARGLRTIMGGPNVVRGGSHSGNVSAADLAEADVLDALSSDYVPASLLHGALLLHERHGMTLPGAIATVTRNPAAMVGLDDRGRIEAGARADLIRVKRLDDGVPVVRRAWRQGEQVL
ncbi:alpha-D-ribose 1-methylphosphonate 5-triphosphate diphosphatase [Thalassobaculum sp.]|uniref:alpha-D-ribose 1-methylphosphonate 5-triphosphate diphosphatase n=1 Tax=Thalassobaculum sp. TaxID=2022740 RepID=UPI0032EBBFC8